MKHTQLLALLLAMLLLTGSIAPTDASVELGGTHEPRSYETV